MLNHFQAAPDFAFGIRQRLAMFARNHLGQLAGVGAQQLLELQHDAHPRALPAVAPGLEGLLGVGDGQVQLFAGGEGHLGNDLLGGGVDHVAPFGGFGLHELAADQ
ncbi:hypothetical protein D3C73_1072900 [compost metagenome]